MKHDTIKNSYCLCMLFFLVGILLPGLNACKKAERKPYSILVIHSYEETCSWIDEMNKGISDCLKKHRLPANIRTFYLDSEYLSARQETDTLASLLDRYTDNFPDLILVCDDQATYSLLKSDHPLTYRIPIVFSGVDYPDTTLLARHPNVTGFTTEPDFPMCYNLIGSLYPDIETITFHTNSSFLSGQAIRTHNRQTEKAALPFIPRIENMDTVNGIKLSWQLYLGNRNRIRVVPVWDVFYSPMSRSSINPTFSVNNEGFGNGYLGGYFTPSYNQTYQATERGVEILKGKKAHEFPVESSKKVFIFDWKEMQKFGISPKQLPKGSEIAYMPLHVRYRIEIVATAILLFLTLVGLAGLFIYLYYAEKQLKSAEQKRMQVHRNKLKVIMRSIREGVISIDKQLCIISINLPALRWLKLTGNEDTYLGRPVLSLINVSAPGKEYYLKEMMATLLRKNRNIQFEYATQLTSVEKQWTFPVAGELAGMYENGVLYGMAITFHDITEEFTRKEFLALTMGTGNVASWHFDTLNRQIVFDKAFFHIFNVEDNGTHSIALADFIEMIEPEDKAVWHETLQKIKASEEMRYTMQIRIDFNGMGYKWWEIRLTYSSGTLFNPQPTLFGIGLHIHKFKQTQQILEETRRKAQQSNKLKSAFLANMSHEIRTPLNAIVGFSNLLTGNEEFEPEEKVLFIETIQNNCNLLLALLSDILDLATIESESMLFKEEVCDVNELINHIFNTQKVIVPEQLQLIKEIPAETVFLKTDRLRMIQVLTNLINNSVKFTECGYVKLGYSKGDDGFLHFFVEDTGKGIPEKDIPNVFRRFFKKDDLAQGAGLGLSICKVIIDHFKGTIGVTSREGIGSRFTVKVPYNENISVPSKQIKTTNDLPIIIHNNMETNGTQNNKINLLIAEDEESNYLLLKTILQKRCNLFRARTGIEAIRIFKEQPVDMILMDIKMPEMNGIDTVKEIRKLSADVPIVMQSAYVFDSDMDKAEAAGANGFLTKPINVKLLKETVLKYCPGVEW